MRIEATYSFPGPPRQVWDLLLSQDALRECTPGVETLTETSVDHFDAVMKVGIAAIKGTYKGTIAIVDKEPPSSYTLQVEGSGGPGVVKGTARVVLEPDGDTTRVRVVGDGQVAGMLAGVGQRMLPGVAKMLMNQFFNSLIKRLSTAHLETITPETQ
jgi:uncharacterized protein